MTRAEKRSGNVLIIFKKRMSGNDKQLQVALSALMWKRSIAKSLLIF